MTTKKPTRDLSALVNIKKSKEAAEVAPVPQESPVVKESRPSKPKAIVPEKAPEEVVRRQKGFLLSEKTILQFDILKAEQQRKGPDLILEALNMLFKKYGKDKVEV